ncbi:MAG: HAD-IA family hydrolase [Chloroflexi bacterium]|nr:HAD-IA family hydrolase [Chloroflexota bacterium]
MLKGRQRTSTSLRAIEAVLFDADGVLQSIPAGRHAALAALLPPGEEGVEEFIQEIFEVERPALSGEGDLVRDMQALLRRHGSTAAPCEILRLLNTIHVHVEILDIVRRIQGIGITCHLTSNQQRHRATYMSEELGYKAHFDQEFYSCDLGHAKPSQEYFEHVLNSIGVPPGRVLFLDDHEVNVSSARKLGIWASTFQLHRGVDNRRALTDLLSRYGLHIE